MYCILIEIKGVSREKQFQCHFLQSSNYIKLFSMAGGCCKIRGPMATFEELASYSACLSTAQSQCRQQRTVLLLVWFCQQQKERKKHMAVCITCSTSSAVYPDLCVSHQHHKYHLFFFVNTAQGSLIVTPVLAEQSIKS